MLERYICDGCMIYTIAGGTPYLISSVAVLVPGLLAGLNHCFWEETMKRGVMRWGSLDCFGSELSALPKPPPHRWSGSPGKPLECSGFPQHPNTGGARAGVAVLLVMVLFIQDLIQRLALMP